MGRLLRRFFHPVQAFLEEQESDPRMLEFIAPLAKVLGRLQGATLHVAQQGLKDPEEAGAAASDYLRLFALTAMAYIWARMAKASLDRLDGDNTGFYKAKLATARFFMTRLLPQSSAHFSAIMSGKAPLMELEEAAF
jgi:butyryl-CoA dehydrogenase